MSKLEVDAIEPQSGTTLTIGASGDTITVPTGGLMTGHNYPAFEAYLSSSQTISDNSYTKVQFDTEIFDTNSYYDNATNYRFTPLVAGKYFVFTQVRCEESSADNAASQIKISKNGSTYIENQWNPESNYLASMNLSISGIIEMNGSTDYLEVFGYVNSVSGSNPTFGGGSNKISLFGAYRIGA